MDDLLADFVAETREMLEAIEGEVVAWEAVPSDRARLDAIFRFVHTVKGNCGFFDFPRLEKLSHAAESALAEVRAGRRQPGAHLVNGVLAIIDRIAELVDAIEAGEEFVQNGDDRLIAALEPEAEEDALDPQPQDEAPNGGKVSRSANGVRSIRLPVELLDRLMSGVSDMVLARNDLARRLREAGNQPSIDGPFERLSTILDDVRQGVTKMRMQRIENLYNALPRLVRDLSTELGKQVLIDLEGGDVELDREMIETVRDPITHIIRNAIDHGIESPSERLAAGKREIGLLSISARQAGNKISLVISDDGRGLVLDRITAKAVANGLATQDEVEAMTRQQKLELIFEAGLSTADQVSEVSGRGVGMDVVRANLEKVGGSIDVDSRDGEGSQFHLQLPLTLSIIAGLTVKACDRRFAIPRSYIEEIARGSSKALEIEYLGDTRFVTFRGTRVPCIELSQVLGLTSEIPLEAGVFVFVRLAGGDLFALAVDRVLDNEDLVVKPLAPALMSIGIYGGSVLLDDGNPILMLDIPNIAVAHGLVSQIRGRKTTAFDDAQKAAAAPASQVVLFESLDGKNRAIRMEAVARIQSIPCEAIAREGDRFQAMLEGAILPLAGIAGDLPDRETVTVLRLSDGDSELLYAVAEVDNTADLDGEIVPADGEALLEGSAILAGRQTGIVDSHALFARHARKLAPTRRPTCRIPQEDGWSRTFLAPLLEAAGYRVTAENEVEADVALTIDGLDEPGGNTAHTIRLRSTPDAGSGAPSIYRYDRESLLAALQSATGGA